MADATVVATLNDEATGIRLKVDTDAGFPSPVFSSAVTATNGAAKMTISGLASDTTHFYRVQKDGVDISTLTGTFKTMPAASFKVAFASCADTNSNATVFDQIRTDAPNLFIHMGDRHYTDQAANTEQGQREAHDRCMAQSRQHHLFRDIPTYYVWDDHDYGPNDSDGSFLGKAAAQAVYREKVPHPTLELPSSGAIYYSFDVGRVRFIVTDLRSEASDRTDTDNASKSMMGTTQKTWFKDLIENSPDKLLVWVSSRVFHANGASNNDHWGSFTTERTEIADHVQTHASGRFIVITGDRHQAGIDDGTNCDYVTTGSDPIPCILAAPLDQATNTQGLATFTSGVFSGNGQYGELDITDNGTTITIDAAVRDSAGTALATDQFVWSTAEITISNLTYTRGTAGVNPDLDVDASSTGTTTANYTLYWATRSTGTALSKTNIENGTGDALDSGSFTATTLAGLSSNVLDLTTSLTSGAIDVFVRDSSSPAIESDVASVGSVNYDANAPVFSSAEVGTVDATSVIVTFDKAVYGSTSAADWDVQVAGAGATESAATIDGATVDITLSAGVTSGQAVTVAYNGTGLVGIDGEQTATFTAQTVTNNVSGGSNSISSITGSPTNTQDGSDEIYTWNADGSFTADADFTIEYLIVAGGGGGGAGNARRGGGGGAGGLLSGTFSGVSGQSYTVTVGAGGVGTFENTVGGNSGITVGTNAPGSADGGGTGAARTSASGADKVASAGGSGGGGSNAENPGGAATGNGTGFAGGDGVFDGGGGGGGAGAAGSNGATDLGGDGGAGLSNSITGSAVTYAGGGGGASFDAGTPGAGGSGGGGAGGDGLAGVAGTDGLGGGGGGGAQGAVGGDGGDGVVIIRFTP